MMEFKDYTEDKAGSFRKMWEQIKTDVINTLKEKFLIWVDSYNGESPKKGDKFIIAPFTIIIK